MPTIEGDLSDLNRLVGRRLTPDELERPLMDLGIEVEEETEDGLKLEVLHNRPDLLGVEGVARSLRGYLGVETGLPDYELGEPEIELEVDPSTQGIRPVAVMGMVRGVEFDDASLEALMDLQENLHKILGRDRQKISIGAYDMEGLEPPIRYTTTDPDGEGFVPLEFDEKLSPREILEQHPKGRDYAHLIEDSDRYPLLVDSRGEVLSMPPIINSESCRVTGSTEEIGVDVTGVDEEVARQALRIIMCAAGERGFELEAVEVDHPEGAFRTPVLETEERTFNLERANEGLGLELDLEGVSEILEKMRYRVVGEDGGDVTVEVPPYRFDLMHEVDLFEDIAVGYGYGDLEPTLPSIEVSGEAHPDEEISGHARRALTGFGFMEVMTDVLTSPRLNSGLMRSEEDPVTVENPVSEEYSILRTWLLPGLMEVLEGNRHHELPQKVFEIGDVVLLDEGAETGAEGVRRAAGAVVGGEADFTYAKSVAEALLRELRVEWDVEPLDHPSFLEDRAAEFLVDGEGRGFVGEVHPEVVLNFELEHPVVAFEIDLPRVSD